MTGVPGSCDWTRTTLGKCAEWVSGGTPPKSNPAYWGGDIPWVSAKDMKEFRLYDSQDHVTPEALGNGTRSVPPRSILLLVRGMTLHDDLPICMVMREMTFNQDVKALVPNQHVVPEFLAYWLLANKPDLLQLVDSASHGTGRIHTPVFKDTELRLPPPSVQQRIADVLGKLDDKNELNRRMNRTLEKMAAAIFKSWFIDFDPVHAKAEGRDPGLPAEVSDLFPSSFEDSELGPIPKGWACSTVGDEFNLTMGQSPPGDTYNEAREGVPFFQGRRDFGFRFPTNRVYCTAPTRYAARGDTLMSVRAPVGDVNMAIDRCSIGRGVAAARHKSTSIFYTYYAFRSLRERFEVYNGEGTVFGSISQKDLRAIPWLAPDDVVVSRFDQVVGPIDQRVEINEVQNRRLAGLRDSLLPKLMSGDIELLATDGDRNEEVR